MYINMDMKYRDRNEIIAQILESTNGDRVRLTKIMYDVYLSHGLTKEYVRLLIEKGLMEYLDGERTFKTTDKGMNFLRIHHKVQELIIQWSRWEGFDRLQPRHFQDYMIFWRCVGSAKNAGTLVICRLGYRDKDVKLLGWSWIQICLF
jgi:predicted transcriptional regulator